MARRELSQKVRVKTMNAHNVWRLCRDFQQGRFAAAFK
jgi:hypothetical protein